jgi:hypothetical protein
MTLTRISHLIVLLNMTELSVTQHNNKTIMSLHHVTIQCHNKMTQDNDKPSCHNIMTQDNADKRQREDTD